MNSNLHMAESAWPLPLPKWLEMLARECDAQSQSYVARRLKVSSSMVNQILQKKYLGDMDRFEARARGAYLSEKIICPVVGEIPLDRCMSEQGNPTRTSSPVRARLYRMCRSGECPYSKRGQKS